MNLVHVPYKGTAPGMTDLIGGRVSVTFASVLSVMPHVKAGKLRVLATAGSRRSSAVPEVSTIAEAGIPGYEVDVWYAALAPAATPKATLVQMSDDMSRALRAPDMAERLTAIGLDAVGNNPDQAAAYIGAEIAKWARVVKAANIRAD